jgi:hypothetical protein
MNKLTISLFVFLSLFLLSSNFFLVSAKTITMDGSFSDWDDVDLLIDDTITDYPYTGTIYYFNNGTNNWQTDSISNACMYTQNRALDLGELKLTNDNDYLYILWKRGSDFLNYYWRRGDATEEYSFSNEAAPDVNSNPCAGEIVTAPVAFDHDLVLSVDTDDDDLSDYYLVIKVSFAEGAYSGYNTAGYIYEDNGNGTYSRNEETLAGTFGDTEYDVSPSGAAVMSAVLQEVKMDLGSVLSNLDLEWGDTVTVKYEAHSTTIDETDTAEYEFTYTNESTDNNSSKEDTRCHWSKPGETTWINFESKTVGGVSGIYLTWVQYDADKIDIFIDNGTGSYPWKVSKTSNDGHEFLPNIAGWQNIKIKPYNHCRAGSSGEAVSVNRYPGGWYNTN